MKSLSLPVAAWAAAKGHVPGLDGLRALSIAIVLLGHFFFGEKGGFASVGVYIFFVISGFLITRLLLAEMKATGKIKLVGFYFRRGLRLMPPVVLFMPFLVVLALWMGRPAPLVEIASVFGYFTNYLQNWYEWNGTKLQLPIGALWSLSVEEHFYLLFPPLVALVGYKIPRLLSVAIAVCVGCLLLRFAYISIWPEMLGTDIIYGASETRFDSIGYGVLLALLCELQNREKIIGIVSHPAMLAFGCVLMLASFIPQDLVFKDTLRFTMRSVAAMTIVAATVFGRHWLLGVPQLIANWKPVAWIGVLSYSIYIWHCGARLLFEGISGQKFEAGLSDGVPVTLMTLGLAMLSYYVVEIPFTKLRHRIGKVATPACVG